MGAAAQDWGTRDCHPFRDMHLKVVPHCYRQAFSNRDDGGVTRIRNSRKLDWTRNSHQMRKKEGPNASAIISEGGAMYCTVLYFEYCCAPTTKATEDYRDVTHTSFSPYFRQITLYTCLLSLLDHGGIVAERLMGENCSQSII